MSKVSIIVPTYNRAGMVSKAIQSALVQPLEKLEVIVVDDGSTDNTRQVVSQIRDARLKYIYQDNQGPSAAFNRGIAESSGDFINILGSDDWFLPGGLVPLLEKLEANPKVGLAAGGYHEIDEAGLLIREHQPWVQHPDLNVKTWLYACPVLLQAALIRREWFERVPWFDENIRGGIDYDFLLHLAYAGCRMVWVEKSIFYYLYHSGGMTKNNLLQRRKQSFYSLEKFFTLPDLPLELMLEKEKVFQQTYLRYAAKGYNMGEFDLAAKDLEYAIQLDPGLLNNGGKQLFHTFAWLAHNSIWARNPEALFHNILKHLPPSASQFSQSKNKLWAEFTAVEFFEAARIEDWSRVRKACREMLKHDPRYFLDRGILSLSLSALLGRRWNRRKTTHTSR